MGTVADWALVRRVDAPKRFDVVQEAMPDGCTTSGQPRLAIGPTESTKVPLTLIGEAATSQVVATERTILGLSSGFGDELEWWEALKLPPTRPGQFGWHLPHAVIGANPTLVPVPYRRRISSPDFESCAGLDRAELLRDGTNDGFAWCWDDGSFVVSSWVQQAKPGFATHRTSLRDGDVQLHVLGRFLYRVRALDTQWLIVQRETGIFGIRAD